MQTDDQDHLKLLTIFHYVVGGLTAFFGSIPLIHLFVGLFLLFAGNSLGKPGDGPPLALMGGFFAIIGGVFVTIGWTFAALILTAGRFLAHRKHYTFCLVVACIECIMMPFGTILGVFTIIVLMRDSVKALFQDPPYDIVPGSSS